MTRTIWRLPHLILCLALTANMVAAAPPPIVDTPIYDCSTTVVLRSFDSGATLRVYVNGVVKNSNTMASSNTAWITISDPLQDRDRVEVSQEVGGIESNLSAPVFVAAPNPAPPIHFELPLVECAKGAYVHNALAGWIAINSSSGDRLASSLVNEGDFPTYLSRLLAGGERLTATVDHCRLGTVESDETLVTNLYGEGQGDIPTPTIRADTAIECLESVVVQKVVPGATVRVYRGATLLGQNDSTHDKTWVRLSAPMDPTWQMEARQYLCTRRSERSPPVEPTPLSALDPPTVEGPIWEGQTHVFVETPVSATITITVDGASVRENVEVYGRTQINVEAPFVAGQQVSAFYTICGHDSPPAEPVQVIAPPIHLPPPMVGFPLFACTSSVSVSGLIDQAEVRIFIDGQEVHHDFTKSASASFTIGPTLRVGQLVTAKQYIGSADSTESTPVVVFDAPDLDPPTVEEPLIECQREVAVGNVLPGAFVTLYVNGSPYASTRADSTTVQVPTLPLQVGWQVQAKQQLSTCQESSLSAAVIVDPFNSELLNRAPTIVEPIHACQTRFVVRDLTPGTELDVYIDGNWKQRVSVSAEAKIISVQPPLREGQLIEVTPVVCDNSGQHRPQATVRPAAVDPPQLHEPIFNGDTYTVVSGVPSSALVLIYNADGDQVGAGMGAWPQAKIYFFQSARSNDTLTATAALCGTESGPSDPVTVQVDRPPLPHDTMVSFFWLDHADNAQALLHVSGRNIYQGSTIRIDGQVYPTFHLAQFTPEFGRDVNTLGTPIDTVGGIVLLLFQDTSGSRFVAGQQLRLSVDNPGGASANLRHYNRSAAGAYTDRYDLAANMARLDSDGDGLTDEEERPGATVDLAALGANPLRRDAFVKVDWMVKRNADGSVHHTHEPNAESFNRVINAFRNAWVVNADGSRGIHLYVDYGQSGGRGGDELDHYDTIAFRNSDSPDVLYSQFYNNDFDANRRGLYHYCVFGHQQPGSSSSGVSYFRSDQFIVTLINSGDIDDSDWISKVAGTFMHELGHNLNIEHGGNTPTNYKPNYPSVMNYTYQFRGISTNCDTSPDGVYNYSYGILADLDETNLDEPDGICDGVARDWNDNFLYTDTGISANINDDRVNDYNDAGLDQVLWNEYVNPTTASSNQPLHDYCDWCYLTLEEVK